MLEYLDELEIPYNLNPFLVRGLDYYNRTVFEIWPAPEEIGGEEGDPLIKRQAAMGGGVHRHGSPEMVSPTMQFVCKPRDGRGTCMTVPYARLGAPCTCDGPRKGIVSTR